MSCCAGPGRPAKRRAKATQDGALPKSKHACPPRGPNGRFQVYKIPGNYKVGDFLYYIDEDEPNWELTHQYRPRKPYHGMYGQVTGPDVEKSPNHLIMMFDSLRFKQRCHVSKLSRERPCRRAKHGGVSYEAWRSLRYSQYKEEKDERERKERESRT